MNSESDANLSYTQIKRLNQFFKYFIKSHIENKSRMRI